jgi:hypothetical protein
MILGLPLRSNAQPSLTPTFVANSSRKVDETNRRRFSIIPAGSIKTAARTLLYGETWRGHNADGVGVELSKQKISGIDIHLPAIRMPDLAVDGLSKIVN